MGMVPLEAETATGLDSVVTLALGLGTWLPIWVKEKRLGVWHPNTLVIWGKS